MPPPSKKAKLDLPPLGPSWSWTSDEPPPPNQLAVIKKPRRPQRQEDLGVNILKTMPLDVLAEVFSHLHPRDLLTLARTSKDFREVLMNKSNGEWLWKKSRDLVGLPQPPHAMSEPAFANLLFSNHCHDCGDARTGNHQILWPIPTRYCRECRRYLLGPTKDAELASWADKCILHTRLDGKGRKLWHKPEMDEMTQKLVAIADDDERDRYVQERINYVVAWKEAAPKLVAWLKDYQRKLAVEEDVLRKKCCVAVLARLRTEGWDKEIDWMTSEDLEQFSELKVLSPARKVDHFADYPSLMREIYEFMQIFRHRNYRDEFRKRVRSRMPLVERALCQYRRSKGVEGAERERACGLRFGDLVARPAVRQLLEDKSPDLTRDAILSRLVDIIPSAVVEWEAECRSQLLDIARRSLLDSDTVLTDEALDLAVVSFQCNDCFYLYGESLRWPQILSHRCLRRDFHEPPTSEIYECEAGNYKDEFGWRHSKWSPYGRSWDPMQEPQALVKFATPIEFGSEVVSACGLDPKTATSQDMDQTEARFTCRICSETEPRREVYNWAGMIGHVAVRRLMGEDGGHTAPGQHWTRLPDEQAAQAKALESLASSTSYRCTWCYDLNHITEIRQHVMLCHEQASPKAGEDYFCETPIRSVHMYSDRLEEDPEAQQEVRQGRAFFARF